MSIHTEIEQKKLETSEESLLKLFMLEGPLTPIIVPWATYNLD